MAGKRNYLVLEESQLTSCPVMADKGRMDTDYDSDVTDASFVSDTTRNSDNLLSPKLLGLNMLQKSRTDECLHGHNIGTDVDSSPIIPLQSSARRRHVHDDEDPIKNTPSCDTDKDMSDVESNASELILSNIKFGNIPHQFQTKHNKVTEITKQQRLCKETSKKSWQPPFIMEAENISQEQFSYQEAMVQHFGVGVDFHTQETACSQQTSISKSTVSNEKEDDSRLKVSASQSLFGDTQNSQDNTQTSETQSIFQTQKHLNIVGESMLDDETQGDVLSSQKQDVLMNCVTFSQVVGDWRDDNQSKNYDNPIITTQTSNTSSLTSLENINPVEDWKNLSKPEQHYREKKVIEKMDKIQGKLRTTLENNGTLLNEEALEKIKQKYKLLQNVLKKMTEYHKEERKRLSDLIQKSNKTKAEKIVLKSSVHQLSGRQKDVFKVYQNHQKLGISIKENLARKKLDDGDKRENVVQLTKQVLSINSESYTTKKTKTKNAFLITQQPYMDKSDLSKKDNDYRTKYSCNEQLSNSVRNLPLKSMYNCLPGKIIVSQNQNNDFTYSNAHVLQHEPKTITPVTANHSLTSSNQKSDGDINMNNGSQQQIARTEFKSPVFVHKEKSTENISPSTASCSDVFPVKSQEIHRRVQLRLSQLGDDGTKSERIASMQHSVNEIRSQPHPENTDRTNIQPPRRDPVNSSELQYCDGPKYPPLIDLLNAGILKPGKNILSMTCKNLTYTGSLTEDGKIESVGGEKFQSPVQWLKSVTEDGIKIVKSRAYREVLYLDKPLLSYVDGTVKLTQRDIASIASDEFGRGFGGCSDRTHATKLMKTGDYTKDLFDCKILLLEETDIIPSKDIPENFWTDDFSSVKMNTSFWNTVDVW